MAPLRSHPRYPAIEQVSRTRFEGSMLLLESARECGELPQFLEQPLADLMRRLAVDR